MGKLLKKIMIGGIIVVLVFGAFVLVGCSPSLQQQTDTLSQQVYVLRNETDNPTLAQINVLLTEAEALQERAERLDSDNVALLAQIEELRNELEEMWNERTNIDFILTISVVNATLPQGQDFVVDVEFKNNSGQDVIFGFFISDFIPRIAGWDFWCEIGVVAYEMPQFPTLIDFEKDSTIFIERQFGRSLDAGSHKLRFQTMGFVRVKGQGRLLNVWSNTVVLTVQ